MGFNLPVKFVVAGSVLAFWALCSHAQPSGQASASSPRKANVYCTNNRDGTGACFNETTKAPFDCVAVQGTVVPCKSPDGVTYECQWLGHHELACTETMKAKAAGPISTDSFTGAQSEFPQLQSPPPVGEQQFGQQPISATDFAETFEPAPVGADSSAQQPVQDSLLTPDDSMAPSGGVFLQEFTAAPQ